MSIPIKMTRKQANEIKQQLKSQDTIICIDKASHIRVLLVALELLQSGQQVKAEIVKGYK